MVEVSDVERRKRHRFGVETLKDEREGESRQEKKECGGRG